VSETTEKFEELEAWQEARNLTREIYKISAMGEFGKDLELKTHTRRAAVSIMFNIATGFVLRTNREFRNYLIESLGGTAAVEVALYIALDQNYITRPQFDRLYKKTNNVNKLIQDLLRYDTE